MNSTYRSKPLPALFACALGLDAAVLGGWLVLVASKAVAESGRQTRAVLRFLQFYGSFIERNCAPGNVCEVRLNSIPAHSLFMATDIKAHVVSQSDGKQRYRQSMRDLAIATERGILDVHEGSS